MLIAHLSRLRNTDVPHRQQGKCRRLSRCTYLRAKPAAVTVIPFICGRCRCPLLLLRRHSRMKIEVSMCLGAQAWIWKRVTMMMLLLLMTMLWQLHQKKGRQRLGLWHLPESAAWT